MVEDLIAHNLPAVISSPFGCKECGGSGISIGDGENGLHIGNGGSGSKGEKKVVSGIREEIEGKPDDGIGGGHNTSNQDNVVTSAPPPEPATDYGPQYFCSVCGRQFN